MGCIHLRSMATRHAGAAVIPVKTSFLKSMMDFQQHQLPNGTVQYSHCWLNDMHKPFLVPLASAKQRSGAAPIGWGWKARERSNCSDLNF
ncbi:hypothetical protein WJX77_005178 [Trebouxia sp. C0004]